MTLLRALSPEESFRLETKIITALIFAQTENAVEAFMRGLEPDHFKTPEYREICRVHMEKLWEGLENCEITPHAAAAVYPGFYMRLVCDRDRQDAAWIEPEEFDRFIIRGEIMKTVEAVHVG
jgi:hypothetical protein